MKLTAKKILTAICVFSFMASPVQADTFSSNKPISIVVPYGPGGITDGVARLIASELNTRTGKTVIVENKPGGGTIIGTKEVIKSGADGHTILFTSFGYIINQVATDKPPYDASKLNSLAFVGKSPNVLYLNTKHNINSLNDLINYSKNNPGRVTFASSGNASSPHLAAELFSDITSTNNTHVPYRGTGAAMADVLGAQVTGIFDTMQSMPYTKDGRLKAIAVANDKRLNSAPELPTFEELGIKNFNVSSWFGFFMHADAPKEIKDKLKTEMNNILSSKGIQDKIQSMGVEPMLITSDDFDVFLDSEKKRWSKLIKERKLVLN